MINGNKLIYKFNWYSIFYPFMDNFILFAILFQAKNYFLNILKITYLNYLSIMLKKIILRFIKMQTKKFKMPLKIQKSKILINYIHLK